MKKQWKILSIALSLWSITNANASNEFNIRIPLKEEMSSWVHADPIYMPWSSVGVVFDCSEWTPSVNTILSGGSHPQQRSCKINEERVVILREKDNFSDALKETGRRTETRVGDEPISRNLEAQEGEWVNIGEVTDCTKWTPVPTDSKVITQTRECTQLQTKDVAIFDANSLLYTNTVDGSTDIADSRSARGKTIIDVTECDDDSWTLNGETCSKEKRSPAYSTSEQKCSGVGIWSGGQLTCYKKNTMVIDEGQSCPSGWSQSSKTSCYYYSEKSTYTVTTYRCPSGTTRIGSECLYIEEKPAIIQKGEYCEPSWQEELTYCVQ